MLRSVLVCVGFLLMSCESTRIARYNGQETDNNAHDGPAKWWNDMIRVAKLYGATGPFKGSTLDVLTFFANREADQRSEADKPAMDDKTLAAYDSYLRKLGEEAVAIEKLNRLQAGCSKLVDEGVLGTSLFSRQTFEAVAKLTKEFMFEAEPRDLFSLMPQNAVKAKEAWTYKRKCFDMDDFEKMFDEFADWMKERKLSVADVDRQREFFCNGLPWYKFRETHPTPEDLSFPLEMLYIHKAGTFDVGLLDTVNEDWEKVPKQDQSVARGAFLTHFLSKPEASTFSEGGELLLKEALEGAFDVCTQMNMPASTNLDEHGFRYAALLATEMFKTLTTTADCDGLTTTTTWY